jgi:hypothetical protein
MRILRYVKIKEFMDTKYLTDNMLALDMIFYYNYNYIASTIIMSNPG